MGWSEQDEQDEHRLLVERVKPRDDRIEELERQLAEAQSIISELLGHLELASVMPSAIGKSYAPDMGSEFMERARSALSLFCAPRIMDSSGCVYRDLDLCKHVHVWQGALKSIREAVNIGSPEEALNAIDAVAATALATGRTEP